MKDYFLSKINFFARIFQLVPECIKLSTLLREAACPRVQKKLNLMHSGTN